MSPLKRRLDFGRDELLEVLREQFPEGALVRDVASAAGVAPDDRKSLDCVTAMLSGAAAKGLLAVEKRKPSPGTRGGLVNFYRPLLSGAPSAEAGPPEGLRAPPPPARRRPKACARRGTDGNGAVDQVDVEAEACAALIDADAGDDTPMWRAVMREAAALGCTVTYHEDVAGNFSFEMVPCATATEPEPDGESAKDGEA